jgi:DNA-binding transcriptional MerR regulator
MFNYICTKLNNIVYTIADLERFSGIKAHTIRIWEKRYELFNPERTEGNHRLYGDADLVRLLNVVRMVNAGHRISVVAKWDEAHITELIGQLGDKQSDNDSTMNFLKDELLAATVSFDEPRLERAYQSLISQYEFETVWLTCLVPVMQKIGDLWITKKITPAQEHFLTAWVRRKIENLIDNQKYVSEGQLTFLLFLPPQEFHELGLLVCQYLIREMGHRVIYLGQNVPLLNVANFEKSFKPSHLVTYVQSNLVSKSFRTFLVKNKTESTKLLLAGTLHPEDKAIVAGNDNILQIDSLAGVKSYIDSLTR